MKRLAVGRLVAGTTVEKRYSEYTACRLKMTR